MLVQGTIPAAYVCSNVPASDVVEAVRLFTLEHPDVRVESVDGSLVRGLCACGNPVFDRSDGYRYDQEKEQYICRLCVAAQSESSTKGKP